MGDPEAESVIPRIQSDLMELFIGVANGDLRSKEITIDAHFCTSIFLVSGGYPEKYEKGKIITGLDEVSDTILFHAGAKKADGEIVTSG